MRCLVVAVVVAVGFGRAPPLVSRRRLVLFVCCCVVALGAVTQRAGVQAKVQNYSNIFG